MVVKYPKWNSIEIDVPEYMAYNGKARLTLKPDNRINKIGEINSIRLVPKNIDKPVIISIGRDEIVKSKNKPKQKLIKLRDAPELTPEQNQLLKANKEEFIKQRNNQLQEIKIRQSAELKEIRSNKAIERRIQQANNERLREEPMPIERQIQRSPTQQIIPQPQRIIIEDINNITTDNKEKIIIGNFNTDYITGIIKINNRLLYTQILNYITKKARSNKIIVLDELFLLPRFEKQRLFEKLLLYYIRNKNYAEKKAIEIILNSLIKIIKDIINDKDIKIDISYLEAQKQNTLTQI
jgi:hypothetical protein